MKETKEMKPMKQAFYKLQCLTNLHVGSGDANYGIIDNEVEKDVVLGTPTIHASGVKGALRAYLTHMGVEKEKICGWFGSDIRDTQGGQSAQKKSMPGSLRFLPAHLLARPVRVSKGNVPYVMATSKAILDNYLRLCRSFGLAEPFCTESIGEKDLCFGEDVQEAEGYALEAWTGKEDEIDSKKIHALKKIKDFLERMLLEENIAIFTEERWREIDLPVVARNQLDNGTSVNLWYEEVVPHESVFYTMVLASDGETDKDPLGRFDDEISNQVIQFGGNASVGCGYIKVTQFNSTKRGTANEQGKG